MSGISFLDDVDKMYDFKRMPRKEFLEFYNYLSDYDYKATCIELLKTMKSSEVDSFFDKHGNLVFSGDIVQDEWDQLHVVGYLYEFEFLPADKTTRSVFYFYEVEKVYEREEE